MKKHFVWLFTCTFGFGLGSPSHAAQLVVADLQCVDVPHGITADGTPISLFHCHGSPNQQWTIANGQISGIGGSCLDVQGSAATQGAQVLLVACNGRASQHWSLSNGQIIGIGNFCLDGLNGNSADHTPLIITACTAAPSQQWSVQ